MENICVTEPHIPCHGQSTAKALHTNYVGAVQGIESNCRNEKVLGKMPLFCILKFILQLEKANLKLVT